MNLREQAKQAPLSKELCRDKNMEMLGQSADQAQREQRFRLLASLGCRVTKAAVAIANSEMCAMVLRFSADFLFLTQSRS